MATLGLGQERRTSLSTGARVGVLTSLVNVLCTYPVLKPVRVWGWGNRTIRVRRAPGVKCRDGGSTGRGIQEGGVAQSQSGEAKLSKARVEPLS